MLIIKHLIERKMISQEQLEVARSKKTQAQSLLSSVIQNQFLQEQDLFDAIAEKFNIDRLDLGEVEVDPKAFRALSVDYMRENFLCPIDFDDDGGVRIVMRDPTDLMLLESLEQSLSYQIVPFLALGSDISQKIASIVEGDSNFSEALARVEEMSSKKIDMDDQMLSAESAILNADKSPVVELVNKIIFDAVNEQASDVHIEPLEQSVELRYRIDGKLRVKSRIPKNMYRHLISRIKIISVLDITETRRPQDGRIKTKIHGKNINLRVSTIPTIFGEKIVLRILDPEEMNISLDNVGLDLEDLMTMQRFIEQPQGMILVCGPTGSGKTSTLYSALKEIKSPEKNILTIEDPVEYTLDGINQIQVNERIGFTFANGLRTILRQDPDCILVGEIRDEETAQIAFRASLTGHLVLSSLHTNNTIAAVTRLKDIGIEAFIIASSLLGVIAQRLLRLNCEHCSRSYLPPPYLIERYQRVLPQNKKIHFSHGEGCRHCRYTGYKGRVGVFEFLPFSSQLRQMICRHASESDLQQYARTSLGMRSMTESGITKVVEGHTTLEELDSILGQQCDHHDLADDDQETSNDIVSENIRQFMKEGFETKRKTVDAIKRDAYYPSDLLRD